MRLACTGKNYKWLDLDVPRLLPLEGNNRIKLTVEDVKQIRHLHQQGVRTPVIAKEYKDKCTLNNVYAIVTGRLGGTSHDTGHPRRDLGKTSRNWINSSEISSPVSAFRIAGSQRMVGINDVRKVAKAKYPTLNTRQVSDAVLQGQTHQKLFLVQQEALAEKKRDRNQTKRNFRPERRRNWKRLKVSSTD